jgi:hypothetical protein
VAKARSWTPTDVEARKPGERTGLDTPVVLAVNHGHWVEGSPMGSLPQRKREVPRLGSMVARLKLKGIDGGSHKRWSMWLNSRLRAKPYPGLDMHGLTGGNVGHAARWNVHRCCMAVVSSCREMLGSVP